MDEDELQADPLQRLEEHVLRVEQKLDIIAGALAEMMNQRVGTLELPRRLRRMNGGG